MRIRQCLTWCVLLGGLALSVACSGDKKSGFIDSQGSAGDEPVTRAGAGGRSGSAGGGRGGASGGKGGSAGDGGGSDSGGASALAPVIEITEPAATIDPNRGPVIIADQVTVLCTAHAAPVAGAKPVDPSTVRIEMLDAEGKSLKAVAGIPTDETNEYTAGFTVASLPSGPLSFQCSANDSASPVHSASTRIESLLDRGPEITIGEPEDKSAHNLQGAMNVTFSVAALPIATGDKQAGVSDVSLSVGGVSFPTVDKGDGTYQASVDFGDKKSFSSPPSGSVPVLITASDSRKSPGKATRTLAYGIVVDGEGPVVTINSPSSSAVVGRASVLSFTIADSGAGVDRSTIQVKMDSITKVFSTEDGLWSWGTGDTYSFKIGSALAANTMATQVLVNVSATDKAGNSSRGDSLTYQLDNVPPVVDLDPANVFEVRAGTADKQQCSEPFDPLGNSAKGGSPDDLQTIGGYATFRALVWDETNVNGQTTFYYAGANRESVRLYLQSDTASPLLADKDGDGICDEIYTGTIPFQYQPTDLPLPFLKLKPVAPAGHPEWGSTAPVITGADCNPGSAEAAMRLCTPPNGATASPLSVVIRHPAGDRAPFEPVIYAMDPLADLTDSRCTGRESAITTALGAPAVPKVGWVCLAARAEDTVGNVGISRPLRLCVGASASNPMPCTTPAPSCTDQCTPPSRFPTRVVRHD